MKHSIKELYRTSKGISTEQGDAKHALMWKTCDYKKNNGSFTYTDANGEKKIAWQFGEKTWFDTQEERDAYKAESNKAYDEMVARNKVIKAINEKLNEKSLEELLDIVAQM